MQLYGFKYSYLILMISAKIYFTQRWYYRFGPEWTRSNGLKCYSSYPKAPEVEPHQLMKFSILPRWPFFEAGGQLFSLCRRYSRHILTLPTEHKA